MLTAPDFSKKQIVFVFFNEGDKMSILNDNFIVKDKEGKTKLQCTCYRLFLVFAIGNFSITSVVLQRAKKFGFYIACMTQGFRLYNVIGATKDGNTLLKKKQYSYSGTDIAKQIIQNKIINQRYVLMSTRNKNEIIKESIFYLDGYIGSLMADLTLKEMMAYEGLSAKQYFKGHFNNVLWKGRQPRVKNDYVNSTMDIGYSILFTFIESIVECYGFDTYVGVLHRQFYMRKSLVCDLVEPFRPLIDVQIKKGINLKQIKEEDFTEINHQFRLKYECSTKYARLFMEPLIKEKDRIFAYIQKYYYSFMKEHPGDDFPMYLMEEHNDNNQL